MTVDLGLWVMSQPGFSWFPWLPAGYVYDRAWFVSGVTTLKIMFTFLYEVRILEWRKLVGNRFSVFKRFREITKNDYWLHHVCLSVRSCDGTEQHGSHWTDFHEIWYVKIFRKSVETIQVPLKPDNNNGYFTWRPTNVYDHIWLNSSQNEKCFRQNLYRKSKHIRGWVQKFPAWHTKASPNGKCCEG